MQLSHLKDPKAGSDCLSSELLGPDQSSLLTGLEVVLQGLRILGWQRRVLVTHGQEFA